MSIRQSEIDIFRGVVTNADLANTPEGSLEECKNLRHLPGKLVKTYGAGVIQDSSANVCPIAVSSGFSVINIFTYINENLTDEYKYVALIQNDSTKQVWVVWFDSDYNAASSDPSILIPFAASSYWVKGDSMTFNSYGRIFAAGITITDSTPQTYTFPIASALHRPNAVDGVYNNNIAWGSVPSDNGHAYYTSGDTERSDFSDIHEFDNGTIKTFDFSAPALEQNVVRMARAGGKTFAILKAKGATDEDKLYWYHNSWAIIDKSKYMTAGEYAAYDNVNDWIKLLNIVQMDDELFLTYIHYDQSDGGSQYHYRLYRVSNIAISPAWNNLWTEDVASAINPFSALVSQDEVSTVVNEIQNTWYLLIHIQGTTANTTVPGRTLRWDKTGGLASLTVTAYRHSKNRTTVGVGMSNDKYYLYSNNTTDGVLEGTETSEIRDATPLWAEITFPSTISGVGSGSTWTWKSAKLMAQATEAELGVLSFVPTMNDGSDDYQNVISYDSSKDTYTGLSNNKSSNYSVVSLYQSDHNTLTGQYHLYCVRETGVSSELYMASPTEAQTSIISISGDTPIFGMSSFQVTEASPSDHLTTVHILFGTGDIVGTTDPIIRRFISIGANPDYSSYPSDFTYQATVDACMGWQELFQTLDVDLEFALYHKAAKNPIVMDKGILRILPGAVGEITGNEAKGLWLGYIDREFYDGLYTPTAAFRAYDKTPLTPDTYSNQNAIGADITLQQWGSAEDTTRYVRYSFIYDGVQESLLSAPITTDIDDNVDKAVFRLKLYDGTAGNVRDSSRITGVRIYEMDSVLDSAVATLIREIGFTLKTSDRSIYGAAGKAATHVWLDNISTAQKTLLTGYLSSGSAYVGHDDGTLDAYFTEIVSFEDLGDDGAFITLTAPEITDQWNGDWHISDDNVPDVHSNIQFSSPDNTGGYFGQNILKDSSVDFRGLNPIGLTIASIDATGNQAFISTSDRALTVLAVAKHALSINSDTNSETTFKYHIGANPYLFYTDSTYYSLFAILEFANKEGGDYNLQGVKYIKVNADYAEVLRNRLWQGRTILDPGGENEEQYGAVTYSGLDQLDVTPVGNLIKLNDREGGGIRGISELFERPAITMKQNASLIDTANTDTSSWSISESPHNIGNIAKHGMVSALGTIYVVYYDGIYGLTSNNMAETDQTPTERLKITTDIEDKFKLLKQSEKEAITGEYDQSKNEILWQFPYASGVEQWAYSTTNKDWRQIVQTPEMDIVTIDENADLMFFYETDGTIRSFTEHLAVSPSMKTKIYNIALERDEILRYIWVFNPYDEAMTVTPYMDGVALTATTVGAPTARQKIVVKRRGLNFQVKISWASSTNDAQLKRIGLEYDN